MWEGGWKNIPQLQKDNFFKFFKNNTRIKPLMTVKQELFYFILFDRCKTRSVFFVVEKS